MGRGQPLRKANVMITILILLFYHLTTCVGDLSYHNPPQASLGLRTKAKVLPYTLRSHYLSPLPSSPSSSFTCAHPGGSYYYNHLQFTDKETEAQKG